uniref:Oxysterols receptor LXR-beta n=1 Tax=Phallusia mammillata TaxID=59560 RepID=A0A6F9DN76_9ASCI|nr:oxysterols receptor LXR-beta [Phallusia mammillata]
MSEQSNNISPQQTSTTDQNNNNKVNLSTISHGLPAANAGVMTMPLAMSLSGLSSLPLALCAMNGAANIGNGGLLQAATNIVNQPSSVQPGGLFLLNLAGNTNMGLSQLIPQLQQQQAIQPQGINPLLLGQNGIGLSAVRSPHAVIAPQTQQSIPQVVSTASPIQLPVATANNQQSPATAFMLVPIQQVPVAQATNPSPAQTTPVAQLLTQTPSIPVVVPSPAQQTVSDVQQQNPSTAQTASHTVAHSLLSSVTSNNIPQLTTALSANSKLAASLASAGGQHEMRQTIADYSEAALNFLGLASQLGARTPTPAAPAGSFPSNPIHDPHISSTIQTVVSTPDDVVQHSTTTQCFSQTQDQFKASRVTSPRISAEGNPVEKSPTSETQTFKPGSVPSTPVQVTDGTDVNISTPTCNNPNTRDSSCEKSSGDVPMQSTEAFRTWSFGLDEFLSSPASSEHGDKTRVREKRKKGPAPKLDGHEVCSICTDKASGYHYGVLTCEGCKGFFRRSIIKGSDYKCKAEGKCEMDAFSRRKCQKCRLERCRAAGMKDESVLSEVRAKRIKKEKDFSSPFQNVSFDGEPIPTLTSHQRNLVEMLQANESRFQWPTQENVAKVTPWVDSGDEHRCRASRFAHFTELAILIVQLVVEFTKQLPGFMSVSREDQIVLLKACTIEVMLLRAAKQFDKKSKAINFLNGKFYDRSSFYRAGIQVEFVDPIFDFCHSMAKLGLDEAEYALLAAINTFSADRPNIKDIEKVEALQDSYVELLRVYLKIHHPSDPLMFPRTLMKLVELRSLNNYHSEQMFALKVQDKQLPPLLAEIWDM